MEEYVSVKDNESERLSRYMRINIIIKLLAPNLMFQYLVVGVPHV